ANAKKEDQIKELKEFIARFSANASKSKQATSRKKQLDKITLDDIQPSSRKYPFIKFEKERDLGNDLVSVKGVSKTIDGKKILDNITFTLRPGEKTAIISRSDVATTVLMQILAGKMEPDEGEVVWGQTTRTSYMPKNINSDFEDDSLTIIDWLRQFASKEESDDPFLRSFLGRM
ncbi:ABC-F family ATPase, partial [Enterococcus lactis]